METIIFNIEMYAQKWFSFMVTSSIQLGLFIIFIFIIVILLRKQSAKFLYLVWLIGLFKIFVPPTIELPTVISNSRFVVENQIPMIMIPEIHITTTSIPGLDYQGFLFLLWIFITMSLFIFWVYKALMFRRSLSHSCREITKEILFSNKIFNSDRVKILTGPNISMSFTKGVFTPKIYLPESALSWTQIELKALILHEMAHVKRKDVLIISIQNMLQLLYFFHPLLWFANIQISRYREKACDDFAIQTMQGKSLEYGKSLLKSIDHAVGWNVLPSISTYFYQSKRFVFNRFNYILNKKEKIMTKLSLAQRLVLIGMVVLAIVFSCQKKESPNQPALSSEITGTKFDYSKNALQAGLVDSQKVDYDTPPMPVGGFEAIQEYLIFPEFIKKAGSTFNVKINETGEITVLEMKAPPQGIESYTPPQVYALGKFEGKLSAVVTYSKWTPAKKNGRPITAWVTIPITYNLKVAAEEIVSPSDIPPPPLPSDDVYKFFVAYDEPPEPIGGFAAIQENLIYPEIARRAGIEGTVTVYARVSENGDVIDTRILVPLNENNGCNEAAVAAIKSIKWKPARAKGKPVAVWVSIPVRFKLKTD